MSWLGGGRRQLRISRVVSEAGRMGRFMGKSLYCNFHGKGKGNR